ncbi:hypothetical protein [Bosea sp. 685]|uniref:hypothetical protein n=1 Tax=Bosea sp. 685 TaxID=3080057 RepID=UPI002892EC26|nr:hypothetical protein [Bosea sp. 685]WNJ92669.1 hypothetical protein RMR04_10365 [Bosea sp. 685]
MQIIDPQAFAGHDASVAQTAFFADQCRANPAIGSDAPVRLPGDQASASLDRAIRAGLGIPAKTIAELNQWAVKLRLDPVGF